MLKYLKIVNYLMSKRGRPAKGTEPAPKKKVKGGVDYTIN